jgi:DNA-binding PadR family transcriptional regulator
MMSEDRHNPRNFHTLEYYLLALLAKTDLRSLYDFHQKAFVEPGSIRISLERLEANGFITRAESSYRNRREFSITNAGRQFLEENWQKCLRPYPYAYAIMRAAIVALFMNHPLRAATYLEGQQRLAETNADRAQRNLEVLRQSSQSPKPLISYRFMRAKLVSERRTVEESVLRDACAFIRSRYEQRIMEEWNEIESKGGN